MAFPADGSAWYNVSKKDALSGALSWATSDIRVMPVMTNHSSDKDDDTIGDFATLDEFDGASYTTGVGGETLGSLSVNVDDTNNRGEADAADEAFLSMTLGTRQITGFVLLRFVTNQASSVPVAFVNVNDFHPNSGNVTIVWSAEAILHIT